jgi:predicted negative regulator of RcsB-dependent stress response
MIWLKENWKLVAGVVLLALMFAAGWTVRSWYESDMDLKIAKVKEAVAEANAGVIADLKAEGKINYAKTAALIRANQMYSSCVADAVTMDLTNRALGVK